MGAAFQHLLVGTTLAAPGVKRGFAGLLSNQAVGEQMEASCILPGMGSTWNSPPTLSLAECRQMAGKLNPSAQSSSALPSTPARRELLPQAQHKQFALSASRTLTAPAAAPFACSCQGQVGSNSFLPSV